eukprot:XP_002589275.1 hypothetical protein BRAFLDRAFT_102517 [Branchiostoma floridae]
MSSEVAQQEHGTSTSSESDWDDMSSDEDTSTEEDESDDETDFDDLLEEGLELLKRENLDKAELMIAKALRSLGGKSATSQRLTKCFLGLGDVYKSRAKISREAQHFIKASALYNSALSRCQLPEERKDIATMIRSLESEFIATIVPASSDKNRGDTFTGSRKHQEKLAEIREKCKASLHEITAVSDQEKELTTEDARKEVEKQRADAIRNLCHQTTSNMKAFVCDMVDECIAVIGDPPSKYAIIGLGSLAREEMTPYSDLEFAILIEEGRDGEDTKQYFRTLTNLLHLKVVNLGETILPSLAIKTLNDYTSGKGNDNWFFDDGPNGFAFDGAMPWACKIPLGRPPTENKPWSVELIGTPADLARNQTEEMVLKEGYNLADVLSKVTFVTGNRFLVDDYNRRVRAILCQQVDPVDQTDADGCSGGSKLTIGQRKASITLCEDLTRFSADVCLTDLGRLYQVKKEIYRLPTLMVNGLATFHGLYEQTPWDAVTQLHSDGVLNAEAIHNLHFVLAFASEVRLRSYLANERGKGDLIVARRYKASDQSDLGTHVDLQGLFPGIGNDLLHRYLCTVIPLEAKTEAFLDALIGADQGVTDKFGNLFDDSPLTKGLVHLRLLQYPHAKDSLLLALKEARSGDVSPQHLSEVLSTLAYVHKELGENSCALELRKERLELVRRDVDRFGKSALVECLLGMGYSYTEMNKSEEAIRALEEALSYVKARDIQSKADILCAIGQAYHGNDDYSRALEYFTEVKVIAERLRRKTPDDMLLPDVLINIAAVFRSQARLEDAIRSYEEAICMYRQVFGNGVAHPDMSLALTNLGLTYRDLGMHKKAVALYEEALYIEKLMFGEDAKNESMGAILIKISGDYFYLGRYRKCLAILDEALQIYQSSPDGERALGNVWTNIGNAHRRLGHYVRALKFYQKAYKQAIRLSEPDKPNLLVAAALKNLGNVSNDLGQHEDALAFHQQALDMTTLVHGEGVSHPDVADSLYNLSYTYDEMEDVGSSLHFGERALSMYDEIFGPDRPHKCKAEILSILGTTYLSQGDTQKALDYLHKSLSYLQQMSDREEEHLPTTSVVLGNIAQAYQFQGDFKMAKEYVVKSLEIERGLYEDESHPMIMESINNLGSICYLLGETEEAISLLSKSLSAFIDHVGEGVPHMKVVTGHLNLGAAYDRVGRYDEAVTHLQSAMDMQTQLHGDEPHPDTAAILMKLASVRSNLGQQEEAIGLYQRSLDMFWLIYGDAVPHSDTGSCLINMGQAHRRLGDYSRAISCHLEGLEVLNAFYGSESLHPAVVLATHRLGEIYFEHGDFNEAFTTFKRHLDMLSRLHGDDDRSPALADCLCNLGRTCQALQRKEESVDFLQRGLCVLEELKTANEGQFTDHDIELDIATVRSLLDQANRLPP